MGTVTLPRNIYEEHLLDFIIQLGNENDSGEVILDFRNSRFYIPSAIVCLINKVHKWISLGKNVSVINHRKASISSYLQRIDFFKQCGLNIEENFNRHDSSVRFITLKKIDVSTNVDNLSTEIAECIAPELADSVNPEDCGLIDILEYSISELVNNVKQHSRSYGFIFAQYTEVTDLVRISIGDLGIGINSSFELNSYPDWSNEMSDIDAINLSLQPEISSKIHLQQSWGESINAGVGLSMLSEFAKELNGHFIVLSGTGYRTINRAVTIDSSQEYSGTLSSFTFVRSKVNNFSEILESTKIKLGLLKPETVAEYGDLFI